MLGLIRGYGLWVMGGLLVLGTLYFQYRHVKMIEAENEGFKTLFSAKMETKKAENGQEMARISVPELSKETLKELIDTRIDTLEQVFGEKLKRVEQFQEVQISTANRLLMEGKQVKALNSKGDSSVLKVFHYQDNWTERRDTVEGNQLRSSSKIRNDLKVLARKGKREKWWQIWKGRKLVAELFSGNPETQITDFQILKVIDK